MAKIRQLRHHFSAGFIDESFLTRSDSAEFENACEELVNFELTLSGGARRRPGGKVFADEDVGHRLVAWEFDEGNKVLVDFGTDFWRIRPVAGETHPVRELANPLALSGAAALRELDYVVVLNTMIVVHPDMSPKVITRNAGGIFTIGELPYRELSSGAPLIPLYRYPITRNIWMSPAAETGLTSVTTQTVIGGVLTDFNQYWNTDHVGQWFSYENVMFQVINLIPDGPPDPEFGQLYKTANVQMYGSLDDAQLLRLYPAADYKKFAVGDVLTGGTTGATVEVIGTVDDALIEQEYYTDVNDFDETATVYVSWPGLLVRPITGTLKAPTESWNGEASASLTEDVTNGSVTSRTNALESQSGAGGASLNWKQQAWNDTYGYPGCIGLYAGRLWFGATPALPNYVWSSKAQDFYNFDVGDGFPDDAIAAPITGDMMLKVRYFSPGPNLEIMTDQGEYFVPAYQGNPITPESFTVRPSTQHGCLPGAKPVRMAYATMFVDRSGAALYRQYYDDQTRSITADLMSGAATSLMRTPVQLARQRGRKVEGQEVLWLVNDDGTATQFRWWPVTGGAAFSLMQRDDGALWKSMCYLDDVRYAIVELASGARIIEEADDDCLLDQHSLLTAGAGQATWTVPDRFAPGTTVHVLTDRDADGNEAPAAIVYLGAFEVDLANQITLPTSDYARIYVGMAAEAVLKPTPIDFVPMDGDTRMLPKKVVSYAFSVLNTYYFSLEGRDIWGRQPTDGTTFLLPRNNEEIRQWQLGYGQRRAPRVVSSLPLPVTLLGFAAEVEF